MSRLSPPQFHPTSTQLCPLSNKTWGPLSAALATVVQGVSESEENPPPSRKNAAIRFATAVTAPLSALSSAVSLAMSVCFGNGDGNRGLRFGVSLATTNGGFDAYASHAASSRGTACRRTIACVATAPGPRPPTRPPNAPDAPTCRLRPYAVTGVVL